MVFWGYEHGTEQRLITIEILSTGLIAQYEFLLIRRKHVM